MPKAKSIDRSEIARFSSFAQDWWNQKGALSSLHKLNPARVGYIGEKACGHFGRRAGNKKALAGLSVLDIGCGGGVLCEPLARMGAKVTGIDASADMIRVAKEHARKSGLAITYRAASAEDFAQNGKTFDIVTVMEIIEHVADMDSLLRGAAAMLKPDGIVIFSTVNRTTKSYLLGIVMAEYVLKWVPAGTHDWRKFVRPSELDRALKAAGLTLRDVAGIVYHPLRGEFHLSDRTDVNYIASATR